MRLTQFRLTGFRSCNDIGTVHLASDITILAGKNESGKSSILEGLHLLKGTEIVVPADQDRTQGAEGGEMGLFTTFILSDSDAAAISRKLRIASLESRVLNIHWAPDLLDPSGPVVKEVEAKLARKRDLWETKLALTLRGQLMALQVPEGDVPTTLPECISSFRRLVGVQASAKDEPVWSDKDRSRSARANATRSEVDAAASPDRSVGVDSQKANAANSLNEAQQQLLVRLDAYEELIRFQEELHTLLGKMTPPIVLFRSFEDELPDYIELGNGEHTSKPIVRNFCSSASLDLNKLKDTNLNPLARRHLVEQATDVYSQQFGKFWNQEPLRIGVEIDGDRLLFLVRGEQEKLSYLPSQRSKGLKWYLSFFLTLSAQKSQDQPAIILIDEPGLYLHAKAQEDLLSLLEDMARTGHQVIIATHSPYLINPDRLDRVRLVVKDQVTKRTRVHNSWYGTPDRDSLTPLITALGLDMSKLAPNFTQMNLVVEGPSDYYYLQAMRHVFDKRGEKILPDNLAIVPCLGHANVGILVSLFSAWNLDFVVVLDKKGTKSTKQLLAQQGIAQERVIRLGVQESDSTIDLFSVKDAEKHIFPEGVTLGQERLSVAAKKVAGVSEVLMARGFLDNVIKGRSLTFSDETLSRFRDSFISILRGFGLSPEIPKQGSEASAS